ncbi:hypothetical protein MTCT_P1_0009 (plasmid) [Methanothermobacter sp. CaT2]|uniref:hypothetical protein n=1 Tax=Methanothermobacter TaxID=145260 RepID=UPI0002CD0BCC|nr:MULTISPECIES: hypothetical protein [Methanothermobacter]WBF07316.1 hypothetical protein ISG36_00055 [Methanothermobacter thermautotrophicus]BAM71007.1 hypothetical protein MTCT_P1_0009 [Methanothermobacter sp. CaT2]
MKYLESDIKCYTRKYKRKNKEYKTVQHIISLRKEKVKSQGFKCNEEIIIIKKPDFKLLRDILEKYDMTIKEKTELQDQIDELQVEFNKLQNKYKHIKSLLDKKEREVNYLENEVKRLQNRGIIEILLEKLRKKKAIEGEVEYSR